MNPVKCEILRKEVKYMLDNDIIEPSLWSSPCVLVPESGGGWRCCADMKAVNAFSRTDSYPIPRVDDCIDRIGQAKYIKLQAPNFEKAFKLQIDASDAGAGAVLIQEDDSGIEHPRGISNKPDGSEDDALFDEFLTPEQRKVDEDVLVCDSLQDYYDDWTNESAWKELAGEDSETEFEGFTADDL
ncbi:uncharacterized protein [Haliotis asinina]|uniref:uncharacterized protein n=1 Tax=Haliotis asinina TaxID=109174 RepID=UPI00353208AA